MQIFVCDKDPVKAANGVQHPKHMVKMPLETTQIAYFAHWETAGKAPGEKPYRRSKAHAHHPCVKWTKRSRGNYRWLVNHGLQLCRNYTAKYGRRHACQDRLEFLLNHEPDVPDEDMTEFVTAINDEELARVAVYDAEGNLDVIATYRKYAEPEEAEKRMARNREKTAEKKKKSEIRKKARENTKK